MRVHYMGYILKRELDVRAAEGTEEVQNWEAGSEDWTLEQRKARRRSKRSEKERWIGR